MIPAPYSLARKEYNGTAVDGHGNDAPAYKAPVPLLAHGVAPGAMESPRDGARDLSMVLYTLYCPAGTVCGVRDLVTYQGADYAVEGEPRDWTNGPWPNPAAGVVIYLKAVQG